MADNPKSRGTLPYATSIGYSRWQQRLMLAFFVVCVALGIAIARGDGIAPGAFLIATGTAMAVVMVRRLRQTEPRLVISSDGIKTANTTLIPWSDITGEEITRTKGAAYVVFDHPGGRERFNISHLDRDEEQIASLLAAYRQRHESAMGRLKTPSGRPRN